MCGIVCLYHKNRSIDKNALLKITDSLKHRGPHAKKIKIEFNGKLGLGHTRLSLVDLSVKADQPMDIDGYLISFNGEIYNHRELRKKLERSGYSFKTFSDAEVIIKSVRKWGIPSALNKLNGCFAFILYDRNNKKLYIVRDPLGEKQIVYCRVKNGDWVFASEAKAIFKHPLVIKEPNIDRFISDLVFKFFSDKKETYFKNIFYFPVGHYLVFDLSKKEGEPKFRKYWDIGNCIINTKYSRYDIQSIVNRLNELLIDSVRLRMDSNCEIGSILSGGVDSSTITKIASEHHFNRYKKPFNCFTVRYINGNSRDLINARLLCDTIKNVNLHEVVVNEKINMDDLDKITLALEEPLLDKIYLAQFMNYKVAREAGLRAVLNGQGADELWLGYYFFYKLFSLPLYKISYDYLIKYWMNQFKFSNFVNSKQMSNKVKEIIISNLNDNFLPYQSKDRLGSLLNFSIKTHLQAMFIQEDRLSMANGVEVRLPHVDLRIVKLALSLPSKIKIFDGREKYILREVGKKFLPKGIYTRKKLGFPDPPHRYDRITESLFNKKELLKSKIVQEIFKSEIINSYYNFPIRIRWMLLAISRMEKIFFN